MVKAPCFQCREHEFTWGSKIPMPHSTAKTAPPKSSILLTVKKNEVVQFSRSVLSDSLWLHELQHVRLPHPSPTPGDCSNSCPLNQWCHPTISSSVIPFSSHLQSFPASLVFSNESVLHIRWPKDWSFSFSISPSNESVLLGLTGWISLQSKGLSRVFSNTTVQKHNYSALRFL